MTRNLSHRTDTNELVQPLDAYEAEMQRRLNEAYWTDNTDDVERLQKRIEHITLMRELGEQFYTRF